MWPWSSTKEKQERREKKEKQEKLREWLAMQAVDVDARDEFRSTALLQAAWMVLLKANTVVDAANKMGSTALHQACHRHAPDTVRALLMSNANLHANDEDGLHPLHMVLTAYGARSISIGIKAKALETLQVLVVFGAAWDAKCDEIVATGTAWNEAPALARCMSLWVQEHADGLALTDVPLEVVKRGVESTQAYIDGLKKSSRTVLRRKICLVGPSCAGKTSFVKSITTTKPQLAHIDNRTIGIDHFPLRFEQQLAGRDDTKIHEVTFWDFAGQDAYQVAHSLFFSPRTLFLVCVDLEAFTVAYLQASIMANLKKQEMQLMDEFIERTENTVTERLLKHALETKLKDVNTCTQEMRHKTKGSDDSTAEGVNAGRVTAPSVTFASCTSSASVQRARAVVEDMITKSNYSFQMPDAYTQALEAIVAMRAEAKSHDITTRINGVFAPIDTLPAKLKLEPKTCRIILQTLHDLGDVLWYEELGVELFRDRMILEPLLLIDFIRQIINHKHTGQTMPHVDLKARPYWVGLNDKEQMKALKQVLQKFHLVYSADDDRTMAWDSDLIVPAFWQTKTPAAWLFLGDILRINPTKARACGMQLSVGDILGSNSTTSPKDEAVRVHWEFHFEFGLPSSLFDHLVVASVSPYFTFDAGPDWIVYEEQDVTACRIMVGRDVKTLHRTMHVEAVVAAVASSHQAEALWDSFEQILGAFVGVLREYPGLDMSSFAWDNAHKKIGLKRLVRSNATTSTSAKWMPPAKTWALSKAIVLQLKTDK